MNTLAMILAALIAGPTIGAAASVTGNVKALCEKGLQGTYTPGPQGTDVCPDGDWAALFGKVRRPSALRTKNDALHPTTVARSGDAPVVGVRL